MPDRRLTPCRPRLWHSSAHPLAESFEQELFGAIRPLLDATAPREQALSQCVASPPSGVLLDSGLPGMDGTA